jgi:protein phosphatase 4 regulatory subunit 3
LENLLSLFDILEEFDSHDKIFLLLGIIKFLLYMGVREIYDILFTKKNVQTLLGIFERKIINKIDEPNKTLKYRKEFKFSYKEIIPFTNRDIVTKIEKYIISTYFRDRVLFDVVEDIVIPGLNNYIAVTINDLVYLISKDEVFLNNLKELNNVDEKRLEVMIFLDEYISMFKGCQGITKTSVNTNMSKLGIYSIIEDNLLELKDQELKRRNINIIYNICHQDVYIIRDLILKKTKFLNNFINCFVNEKDIGNLEQMTETFKILFNPETMKETKIDLLNIFYEDNNFLVLTDLLLNKDENKYETITKSYLCIILSFYVHFHTYRIKNFIIKQNLITKMLKYMVTTEEKIFVLNILKFFKSCLIMNDIFINSEIIKENSFERIFELWNKTENKYNLISSTILDILENCILKRESSRKILYYIIDKFKTILEKEKKTVSTFSEILNFKETKKEEDEDKENKNTQIENDLENDEAYLSNEIGNDNIYIEEKDAPHEKFDLNTLNIFKKKEFSNDDDEFVLSTSPLPVNKKREREREIIFNLFNEDEDNENKKKKLN